MKIELKDILIEDSMYDHLDRIKKKINKRIRMEA